MSTMTTNSVQGNGQLVAFEFDGVEVRTVTGDDGQARFVLADLCRALGIRNPADVARRLRPTMKGIDRIDTPGGAQEMTVVNEPGMYAVVMRSDKPEAIRFQDWVTGEVLPAIRRHGGYLTPQAAEAALTDPDFIIRLATTLKEERARRRELEQQAAADVPKVLLADAVTASGSTILIGDLAKILRGNGVQIGANRLFEVLRQEGYLVRRRGSDWNTPTQRAMDLGLFRVHETAVIRGGGEPVVRRTTKVTGKGQAYFVARFLDGRLPTTT